MTFGEQPGQSPRRHCRCNDDSSASMRQSRLATEPIAEVREDAYGVFCGCTEQDADSLVSYMPLGRGFPKKLVGAYRAAVSGAFD